jgi:hypothetical protein
MDAIRRQLPTRQQVDHKSSPRFEITIEHGGKQHAGSYSSVDGTKCVDCPMLDGPEIWSDEAENV